MGSKGGRSARQGRAANLRSPIFRRLLLGSILSILVTLAVLDFFLTRFVARREIQSVEAQLTAQARIFAGQVAAVPRRDLEAWAVTSHQYAGARVTLIDPNGRVLADSDRDPETMEDHSSRPEIQAARKGRTGSSIRRSTTLGRDLSYVAVPLSYEGKPGYVLRLALPVAQLDGAVGEVRMRILEASLLAATLALIVAYLFWRTLANRIRRLQSFAERLLSARYSDEQPPPGDDELGQLGRSLTRMASELRDVFERLSLESARREAILSSMVEGVLAVDRELCVTFCNESFARAVGARYPVPERLPLLELVRDPGLLSMLTRALVTGNTVKQRLQVATAVGRGFEVQVAPLVPARRGAVAILHDITDIERLERVRKDFVANVSHELRTPLTAIRGYTETLLDGAIDDQENNRKFLEIIRSHSIRLNHIASDLLVLSDLESGKPAPEPERVSIRAAIETALNALETEAQTRGVSLTSGKLADATVLAHRIRLEQAFVNLVDNAIKFNRPGGSVFVESEAAGNGSVQVTISDTGTGIPSEDLPRIFERFYRVDKARSREVGGTGLGLSIVKHVIERMNGTIQVESTLGKGSTFTVVLPIAS